MFEKPKKQQFKLTLKLKQTFFTYIFEKEKKKIVQESSTEDEENEKNSE